MRVFENWFLINNPKDSNIEQAKYELLQSAAVANTDFVNSFEKWLMAVIQANYGKSDQEIMAIVLGKCKRMLAGNISFHDDAAKLQSDSEPVVARQHRLLADIYCAISETRLDRS